MVYSLTVFMPSFVGGPPFGSLIVTGDGHTDMVPGPVLPHNICRLLSAMQKLKIKYVTARVVSNFH